MRFKQHEYTHFRADFILIYLCYLVLLPAKTRLTFAVTWKEKVKMTVPFNRTLLHTGVSLSFHCIDTLHGGVISLQPAALSGTVSRPTWIKKDLQGERALGGR